MNPPHRPLHPPRPTRASHGRLVSPRWWRLYFALAAFDLVTISFSLWLNHRLMDAQREAVAENQEWARHLGDYAGLAQLAGEVNAPGNDIFDSKDADAETARMMSALAKFDAAMQRAVGRIDTAPPAFRARLAQHLSDIAGAMREMAREANLIFAFFREKQPDRAGERMATMDRRFAELSERLATLSRDVREIQGQLFAAQQARAEALSRYEYLIAAAIVAIVVAVTFYGHRMARAMRAMVDEKERYLHELGDSHAALERRVEERTSELRAEIDRRERLQKDAAEAHARLLAASRQAGMAEVATGVLHNVGNVLTSVNLSVDLVVEHLRKSRAGGLTRVAALFRANRSDLGRYLTHDEKGRLVPDYLIALADEVAAERAALEQEARGLQENVGHIKHIVAMQQSYAKVAGAREQLALSDLVADALRMCDAGLERHHVEVVREFESVPAVFADRHLVLQVLVNLINNAKQALDARAEGRRITLRLSSSVTPEGERVRLEVADNGVGIARDNLARIFSHGFTTKKTGHGFGLHSGANAAKEMGGSLVARSDGPGTGATFTLELPVADPAARQATTANRAA